MSRTLSIINDGVIRRYTHTHMKVRGDVLCIHMAINYILFGCFSHSRHLTYGEGAAGNVHSIYCAFLMSFFLPSSSALPSFIIQLQTSAICVGEMTRKYTIISLLAHLCWLLCEFDPPFIAYYCYCYCLLLGSVVYFSLLSYFWAVCVCSQGAKNEI
jgi:hypothetical protein